MPRNRSSMGKVRVAINGFGRIGRHACRIALSSKNVEVVAINDLSETATLAYLLEFDSVYGRHPEPVSATHDTIVVGKRKILAFAEREPERLPWTKLNVDVVLECTGAFTSEEGASRHFAAGARKVIVSAPAKGNVPTFVRGVNDHELSKKHRLINNASCTTNSIAPVMSIIEDHIGIKKGLMTTVHAYTSDQNLHDGPHRDLRRARGAAMNIIPTTTGAAIATTEAIPALAGKFDGIAVRVPVPVGSLSDFTIVTKRHTTVEEINQLMRTAAEDPVFEGILRVEDKPIVSSDIIGDVHSCVVDLSFTKVVDGDLVKILAWYDNEYAYSHRLIEMAEMIGKL